MDDLIRRQETIDAILNLTNSKTIEELSEYIREHDLDGMWSGGVKDAIDVVIGLPSQTTTVSIGRSKSGITMWYKCGNCCEPVDIKDNYCWNCGRRLLKDG